MSRATTHLTVLVSFETHSSDGQRFQGLHLSALLRRPSVFRTCLLPKILLVHQFEPMNKSAEAWGCDLILVGLFESARPPTDLNAVRQATTLSHIITQVMKK